MEHCLVLIVAEIHVEKPYVPGELGISNGSVFVGMLPCPHSGSLLTFGNNSVFLLGVDQCNIAPIGFGLLIHKLENTLSARDTHYHRIYLEGYLTHVAHELLGHIKEGNHNAYAERRPRKAYVTRSRQEQKSAYQSDYNVKHVAHIVHDGS